MTDQSSGSMRQRAGKPPCDHTAVALRYRVPAAADDKPGLILASALHLYDLARERQPEREQEFAVKAAAVQTLFERAEYRERQRLADVMKAAGKPWAKPSQLQ